MESKSHHKLASQLQAKSTKQTTDLHNSSRRVELALRKLHSPTISKRNRDLVLDFVETLKAEGVGFLRISKYTHHLIKLAELLNKSFDSASKKDILKVVAQIESSNYKEWAKHDYKVALKRFYKWLKNTEDTYPEEVRWIKPTLNGISQKLPESLLTEAEVKRLAEVSANSRDKALVQTLHESGCRVGELLTLKIKHLQFDEYGAVLIVQGKTGMRRVRIIASAPALAQWIQDHPQIDEPEAPLWIGFWNRNYGLPLSYSAFKTQLQKLTVRAGIKNNVHPHLFRHSRASHLANHLTEAQVKH